MASQQQAAELYREAHDASAEAWAGAATRATANMHPCSSEWDENAEQAAYLARWNAEHPQTPRRPFAWRVWLARFGLLCLFGVGLALALTPLYLYRQSGDSRWMAVSVVGWLIVCLVWRAARR